MRLRPVMLEELARLIELERVFGRAYVEVTRDRVSLQPLHLEARRYPLELTPSIIGKSDLPREWIEQGGGRAG